MKVQFDMHSGELYSWIVGYLGPKKVF